MESEELLYDKLSEPLKKIKVEILANTLKNCYPEKWLTEEFTNEVQIEHC